MRQDARIGALLDHVRSYYEALNSGDPDRVAGHFTDDAVHYYTRLARTRERAPSAATRSGRWRTSRATGRSRTRWTTASAW